MDTTPWYRQFWPWFIFGLPFTVVIAGLVTVWIAVNNADSVVVDDYYKEGLAINRELGKEQRATDLRLTADLRYDGEAIDVFLAGDDRPAAMVLKLSHPMDEARDQTLALAQVNPGHYRVPTQLGQSRRWHWQLEPLTEREVAEWRLDGVLRVDVVDAR